MEYCIDTNGQSHNYIFELKQQIKFRHLFQLHGICLCLNQQVRGWQIVSGGPAV